MKLLGIRYCVVDATAESFARFLRDGLGVAELDMGQTGGQFTGAVFPAGDSWVEMWPESDGMPATTMLQLVVDDADAFAAHARQNGLEPNGPVDAHGERIYYITAPSGLPMSVQSKRG
jgi:hypothetical protein